VVIRSVLAKSDDPVAQATLLTMVSPPSIRKESAGDGDVKQLSDTLKLLHEFGVVLRTDDNYRLPADLMGTSDEGWPHRTLARHIRRSFLSSENAGDSEEAMWGSDRGSRDFCRSAAWFLMQDIWRGPWKFPDPNGVEHEQRRQVAADPDRKQPLFNGPLRWDAFSRWAIFTGLARPDVAGLLPDPTEALADELLLHEPDVSTPIRDFLSFVANRLPVLDGGTYYNWVKARRITPSQHSRDNTLSPALTHSLQRLQAQGRLRLEDRADAPDKAVLSTATERARRVVVSHVTVSAS
jgi:hypothetical protein